MGAAALLAVIACGGGGGGGSSIPSPVVRSITPATGYSGSATPVVISGDNFLISPTSSVVLAWLDQAALTNVVWIDVHTIHATVPAGLSSGTKTLRVQNAYGKQGSLANAFEVDSLSLGALSATVTALPGTVSVGQAVTLTATVSNVGTGTVTAIQPNEVETSSIDGAAATVTGPDPASLASLAAGDSTTFTWVVVPTAVGHLDLAVSVAGNDVFSGQKVPSPPVTAEVLSQLPAGLVATISASRSTVDANQPVTITFTVTNGGQAGAIVNAVVSQVLSGTATCQTVTPAPPITVPAGGSRSFAWSCSAPSAGVLSLSGSATGVDANSSAPLTASPNSPATVTVQAPAALAATLGVDGDPTSASVGQPLAVRLTVRNTGGATAGVTGTALAATQGAAACTSLGPATPQTVPGGTSLVFSWTCLPAVATPLNLTAAVTGSDANTGAALTASASLPSPITVQLPPALVATVSASPGTADVGQPITVLFTVGNGGSAQAKGVVVTPAVSGSAAATCGAVTPGATNIAANGSQISAGPVPRPAPARSRSTGRQRGRTRTPGSR